MSRVGSPVNRVHQLNDRLSSKRKLDDSGPSGYVDVASELDTFRTRKDADTKAVDSAGGDQITAENQQSLHQRGVSGHVGSICPGFKLQFFVRQISDGNTLVLHGNPEDLVESVHQRIRSITGIPLLEQRLIYRGKQLQWDQSLAECAIQNDSALQLVGRMRSTHYPLAWQLLGDLISHIFRRCKGDMTWPLMTVKSKLMEFMEITFGSDSETAAGHLEVFLASAAPSALVMLYLSPRFGNKECAAELIRQFIISCRSVYSMTVHTMIAPILLEFSKLLHSVSRNDHLYSLCRSSLASVITNVRISWDSRLSDNNNNGMIQFVEIFPIFSDVAANLFEDLSMCVLDTTTRQGQRFNDVRDFAAFSASLQSVVMNEVGSLCFPLEDDGKNKVLCNYKEIRMFYDIYNGLVEKIESCLSKMDELLEVKDGKERRGHEVLHPNWSQYLTVLKVLNKMSMIYEGGHKQLWMRLRHRKTALCYLIVNYAKNTEDNSWILELKDVTDFEARRHVTMMMLPEVKDDEFDEQHEMLIDRSELLVESYEYIIQADPADLRVGLRMEFKAEEASGPGVLREWFFSVCQAIFNPANSLFLTSWSDRRRFYPNPAASREALQLEYYKFAGRVVALALTHKVQVGILLDRILFVQLAGSSICLEDIRDAEPEMYSSCKKILEMDADVVDSDVLGLTFAREVELEQEDGGDIERKVVELCVGGKGISVNSGNRKQYVDLLIRHTFVTSMSRQVSQFAAGFGDIMRNCSERQAFFRNLELEDFDRMLHGEERALPVEDWMKHTGYNGYKKTDRQIKWFWKMVEEMSAENRKNLLFFWTSVRYLPMEGFRGLGSRLLICRSTSSDENHLPSSHTCFYRLSLPPYSSKSIMKERLRIITQEHISGSFGTL